jgi:hypothetical protein
MEMVYNTFFESLGKYQDAFVILGGDFNACMYVNDSLNRVKTKQEPALADLNKAK